MYVTARVKNVRLNPLSGSLRGKGPETDKELG